MYGLHDAAGDVEPATFTIHGSRRRTQLPGIDAFLFLLWHAIGPERAEDA